VEERQIEDLNLRWDLECLLVEQAGVIGNLFLAFKVKLVSSRKGKPGLWEDIESFSVKLLEIGVGQQSAI